MHSGIGKRALAAALLVGLTAPGFAAVCGTLAAMDPMECCRTESGCKPAASLEEAQSCCDNETSSRSSSPALPRLTAAPTPAASPAESGADSLVPAAAVRFDMRADPVRLPPRDLVKLHSSYLI